MTLQRAAWVRAAAYTNLGEKLDALHLPLCEAVCFSSASTFHKSTYSASHLSARPNSVLGQLGQHKLQFCSRKDSLGQVSITTVWHASKSSFQVDFMHPMSIGASGVITSILIWWLCRLFRWSLSASGCLLSSACLRG
mmetsp:Transcript_74270/g.123963  ORF Transcript_74270/g.123963 Transcript_74270/m.123963 type:complete len:138 (+) Transcript_74270:246-659(+)